MENLSIYIFNDWFFERWKLLTLDTTDDGIEREITFLTDCQVSLLSQFRDKKPKGLHGGCDAQSGENSVIIDDQVTSLEECFDIEVEKGQRILIKTPGGGGWGIAD